MFERKKNKIVIAFDYDINERNEFMARNFLFGTCMGKRINAGTYIGYVSDIMLFLNTVCNAKECSSQDDQMLFTQYCSKHNDVFYIDEHREIFILPILNQYKIYLIMK